MPEQMYSNIPQQPFCGSSVYAHRVSRAHREAGSMAAWQHVSQLQWEIHVDFNNGMWWAMPHYLSDLILKERMKGAQQVTFVWDWGETRKGSYQPDGAETSHNRYIIDFDSMEQRNLDNDRTRTVKVVAVLR